jgi:hypothetical protein
MDRRDFLKTAVRRTVTVRLKPDTTSVKDYRAEHAVGFQPFASGCRLNWTLRM